MTRQGSNPCRIYSGPYFGQESIESADVCGRQFSPASFLLQSGFDGDQFEDVRHPEDLFREEDSLGPVFGESGDLMAEFALPAHPFGALRRQRQGFGSLDRISAGFDPSHVFRHLTQLDVAGTLQYGQKDMCRFTF